MSQVATLHLMDEGGNPGVAQGNVADARGRLYQAAALNVVQSALFQAMADFLKTNANTSSQQLLRATMAELYGRLSPSDRQSVDDSFRPSGFLNFINLPGKITHNWCMLVGQRLEGAEDSLLQPPSVSVAAQASTGGARGCGCGTPGCNRGGAVKLSPGFLAKVRKIINDN